ncbi:sporulation YhaL family protein [Alkalihalobacillus sp. BA299]|uniref:sporulation YhaL family protein n=1 Tax=Alkalihalobacillus sp. BA299 TaxID=2815938 RepID=UPI001AD95201|nr:sporulation YhaL family protein [Alkalihalobacillus sp. BA299]
MKNKQIQMIVLVCIGLFLFFVSGLDFSSVVLLNADPWWMYFVVLGILVSAYYFMKYSIEDKKIDEEFIEKEGQVFMERIEEDRAKRREYSEKP